MTRKTVSFNFKILYPGSIPTPTIDLKISDLEGEKSEFITAEVDTGFEGTLLIPISSFNNLNLMKSQLPPDFKNIAITASGEQIELYSAYARLTVPNLLEDFEIEIDSHATCHHSLIGRGFLNILKTIIDGPNEIVEFQLET